MKIEFEVVEGHMRQHHADNADNGDDLSLRINGPPLLAGPFEPRVVRHMHNC